MLGFSPIASQPISGSSFSAIVAVEAALAATVTLTFSMSANAGNYAPMSATAAIEFSGSAFATIKQAITGTASIAFSGTPRLFVAGKPIVIAAVPQSFTLRATQGRYTLKALPQSFTIRGVR